MTIQAAGVIPVLSLGQRLDIAMHHGGYKPETLAAEMRCSATTIRNYLSGRTHIDYAHASMWAQLTGVDLDWLLDGKASVTGGLRRRATMPVTQPHDRARVAA
jgi:transcriptional regulator with XRE-family HTH domain